MIRKINLKTGVLNIMQNLTELMEKIINEESIIHAVFSGVKNKSEKTFNKVTIKKVTIKDEVKHQFEYIYDKNVEHKNLDNDETFVEMYNLSKTYFKQILINTVDADYHILISKKGEANIKKKAASKKAEVASHNRKKKYILNEGELTPFLIELGIMTSEGKIVNSKYDKFKQINRYLELVSDCIPYLDKNKMIPKYHEKMWGGRFEVMVGYSDSSKENGVFPSRFMISNVIRQPDSLSRISKAGGRINISDRLI